MTVCRGNRMHQGQRRNSERRELFIGVLDIPRGDGDETGSGTYADTVVLKAMAAIVNEQFPKRRIVIYHSGDYKLGENLVLHTVLVPSYGAFVEADFGTAGFVRRATDICLHYQGSGSMDSLRHYNALRFANAAPWSDSAEGNDDSTS